ncbi:MULTISPECIES: imidazole glycerol phosphate synthase subunit HisH [Campylobacter]|uniref:Imidazole glycerol phosphate synthase subunit HisH n=1 Tax=Campylobacter molothri TaxID=1032242 RepID=A0ACC5W2P8_9BACT|nr:imidazole glycerol phosphate synthase subunit HisH [Campylobacter sp. RM13744]MBZ7956082.1 imidazole glycerol phosphate synthase subunit HisH [Campylobacter sp. RM17709]MBZ7958972.1 imidazole glycerol phosphate synthase subunit HisH [Campylobacter sp. RM9760]MBZ7973714.1 imidazole glycerol phosphate synthase subunit HisH [Campylobacter sp. RM9753]MBZ7975174.1 imidazole glycerol phosphate synthase subunit HisH [Campylobacter sp. RM9754]
MIGVIDYGAGNLNSVLKALEKIGIENFLIRKKEDFSKAKKLILPGVGSFKDAMTYLKKIDFIEPLKEEVLQIKKPILGICLGMQLFLEKGYEGGICNGLGFLEGEVVEFERTNLKIPHMGWNDLEILKQEPLYKDISLLNDFYFVHSFYVKCDEKFISAKAHYGHKFTASIQKDNIFGVQFHPEKSQILGLKLLENFSRL